MGARNLVIEEAGIEYGGQIGTIKSTALGWESHGVLSASLIIEWKGGGVSVGGFCLDEPVDRESGNYDRKGTAYGLDHIMWIMKTVGVEKWEALVGKQVIVLFKGKSAWGSQSVGIASTTDESQVLVLANHAQAWRDAEGAENV